MLREKLVNNKYLLNISSQEKLFRSQTETH